ncbi:tetratricopeptide repeat protein [Inmirania thermothiophila]|uniref:Flp pilus assembly protein TadD n=1 Tax=Inmirania thermothiophila TaxID=1750597 RepID=A0A3N1Y7M4_9GAMM|nr:tetratricopeptide repeat protein [Inmirania thermothiophila]ROR34803.1 Flp pilus assembly protein TadD [Inmirania thermothiophila]
MRKGCIMLCLVAVGAALAGGCAAPRVRVPLPEPPEPVAAGPARYDGEILYQILAGEFLERAGRGEEAAAHYLWAARASRDAAVARRAAQVALDAGRAAEALEAGRLWLALEPASLPARQVVLVAHLRLGQTLRARRAAEALLEAAGGDEQAWRTLVAVLAREPDREAAAELAQWLAQAHGERAEAHYLVAALAAGRGDRETALRAVDEALARRPDWSEAWELAVQVRLAAGRGEEAAARLADVLRTHPAPALRLIRARLLVRLERLDEAREEFGRLLRERPDDGEVLYALALLALRAEETAEAERLLRRLVAMDVRTGEAAYFLGQIAERAGRTEEAMAWYGKVRGGRYRMEAALRRAVLEARAGEVEAALARLRRLRAEHPAQAAAVVLAEADILREAGRREEALALLGEALAEDPDHRDLLYTRALVAAELGRVEIAEADLRRILAADPDDAGALNALGYTLADRTTRYEEAYRLIERALRLRPDDPAILDSMGWVLYRLGRLEEATRYLRRALDQGWDAEIAAHLGEVLWVRGYREEARKIWADARHRAPDAEVVRRVMERFLQ